MRYLVTKQFRQYFWLLIIYFTRRHRVIKVSRIHGWMIVFPCPQTSELKNSKRKKKAKAQPCRRTWILRLLKGPKK